MKAEACRIMATRAEIAQDVVFGRNVTIEADQLTIRSGVVLGDDVTIAGVNVYLDSGACIQERVSVSAAEFAMGFRSRIETRCMISGLEVPSAERIVIGDCSLVGSDCRLFLPVLKLGDFAKIHNHTLINGGKECLIGHNTWVGQNNILNANESLIIGNNVGLGIYTSIWTHAFYGDLLEGCNVFKVAPTVIEDDVWVMGSYNVIAPGVRIGSKAIVLSQSFVNKDVPANHCVAGNPIKDITDHIVPFRTIPISEKMTMLREFVREFLDQRYRGAWFETSEGFKVKSDIREFEIMFVDVANVATIGRDTTKVVFSKQNLAGQDYKLVTVFDLSRREYTKRRTEIEIELIKFLVSYRAKFVPMDQPRVE